MFTVMDQPCRSSDYNELPEVLAADAALKPLQAALDKLISFGSQACDSTPFAHGSVGGLLLHRHWEIQDGECIIERPGLHPSGRPALISVARSFGECTATAPSRFKVDPKRGELVALEFSADPSVLEMWRALNARPDVLDRLCEVISDSGLADKVGLGILARGLPIADGESLVEDNWEEQSVLSARILSPKDDEIVIQTSWPFVAAEHGDAGAPVCVAYCFQAGGGSHTSEHYRLGSPPAKQLAMASLTVRMAQD
jgi:hypothetical protein